MDDTMRNIYKYIDKKHLPLFLGRIVNMVCVTTSDFNEGLE